MMIFMVWRLLMIWFPKPRFPLLFIGVWKSLSLNVARAAFGSISLTLFLTFQVYSIWYKSTTKPNWNFQKKQPRQLYAPVFMASNGIWSIFKALQNVILPSTMSMPWKQDWISILWLCKKFWLIVLASFLRKLTCAFVIFWSVSVDGFLSGEKFGYFYTYRFFNFLSNCQIWNTKRLFKYFLVIFTLIIL